MVMDVSLIWNFDNMKMEDTTVGKRIKRKILLKIIIYT